MDDLRKSFGKHMIKSLPLKSLRAVQKMNMQLCNSTLHKKT